MRHGDKWYLRQRAFAYGRMNGQAWLDDSHAPPVADALASAWERGYRDAVADLRRLVAQNGRAFIEELPALRSAVAAFTRPRR